MMQANRSFLRRAVTYLSSQGISQFLDIGSGIPTVGNVHEIAQRENPKARVVYVDNDPVAVTHSRAILAQTAGATVIEADLRHPNEIVDDPQVRALIDASRPVALLLVAVLHFVPEHDDPYAAVAALCDRLPAGSHLVISHASSDGQPELAETHQQLYKRTPTPMTMRTGEQITKFFSGLQMVPPGLVPIPLWRPDDGAASMSTEGMVGYAGVGYKT
jgi:hypothetical protein